ncbi:MAG: hypothetical protein WBQ30_14405, partial [Thermoanaerobaculia bacterium]
VLERQRNSRQGRRLLQGPTASLPHCSLAFWGDRYGKVKDPFGLQWGFATQTEQLNEEEMGKRAREWFASMG